MSESLPYLLELTVRLADGCGRRPAAWRRRMARAVRAFQQRDHGFRGRDDSSDLYYTAFAVRTLAVLDELDPLTASSTLTFLRHRLAQRESLIDLVSLIFAAYTLEAATGEELFGDAEPEWNERLCEELERFRCADGGYARTHAGRAGSIYQTFLQLLCYELLDAPVPDRSAIVSFVRKQAAEGGGFVEIRVAKRAGVNPTAAAIGILELLDALDQPIIDATIPFLVDLQTPEGGMRANTRTPIPDLLSTFTGLWTLDRLGAVRQLDLDQLRAFTESLETERGYLGAAIDEMADAEYTFYGVGTMALLERLAPR